MFTHLSTFSLDACRDASCVHESCARCCARSTEVGGAQCPAHDVKKQRKDAEAKMVMDALERQEGARSVGGGRKVAKKLKRGTFAEEGFEEMGDTVLIWSLQRYLAKPGLSQEHLEAQRRARRGKRAADVGGGGGGGGTGSISATSLPSSRAQARRDHRAKYATLADSVKAALASRALLEEGRGS